MNEWRNAAGSKKLVLHIGSGALGAEKIYPRYQTAEWHEIRIANDDAAKPDLIADIRDLSMIPDTSIDAIWVNHALEHLETHEVPKALAECYRIIKHEGEMGACVPDLAALAAHIAHGRLEKPLYKNASGQPVRPIDMLYGFESEIAAGQTARANRTGFSAESLVQYARDAGFTGITVMRKELHLWLGSFKYPNDHPKFTEKARILHDTLPELPPKPPLSRESHPGAMHAGKLSDELDVPPKIWDMA